MLNIGQIYNVKIEETNIFANGVCHIDNMVVFVLGSLEGEICEIEITKVFSTFAFAKVTRFFNRSEYRVEPQCPHFSECGGCSFSHLDIDKENEIKYNYVKSSFLKHHIDVDVEKTVCPVSEKYRNKVVLFYGVNGFGYMQEGTNKIVSHKKCALNCDLFDEIADFTSRELKNTSLRALYLRKSSEEMPQVMVCPIFYKKTDASNYARKITERFPEVKAVAVGINGDKKFALENVKFENVIGDGYITDTLCGLRFRISLESFYQINTVCAEMLYEKAIELADLDENSVCADLFCGTGTIGIISAHKTGATVYGVEIVEKAVEDAKYNARINGIENIYLSAMDASKFDKEVDVCIIDPPRKGCLDFMLDTLKRLKPKKIVYVSCNVNTMIRDIMELSRCYKISSPVSIFNLFPRTSHVESVVCLSRAKST